MKPLVMIIVLLFVTSLTPHQVVSAQGPRCDAIADYLDAVDTLMAEEVHALVTKPGWARDAQGVTSSLGGGADIEGISAEEIDPLVDLLSIPGDVLNSMEADLIPEDARFLHESSTGFWRTLIQWVNANINGDSETVTTTLASIERFSTDNAGAQTHIDEECPGLVDSRGGNRDKISELFEQIGSQDGDPDALANAPVEDFDGIGVYFLVTPQGWGLSAATPAHEPATVRTVTPATPTGLETTPAATPGD